ncbi:MAG TPA: hypothetical protein VGJ14_11305 [Sporichthyaceae bacterium]
MPNRAVDVDAVGRDVDAVLRRLPVRQTYTGNMFRVTGVLTDATSAQLRRRREEVTMAARLGTSLPSPFGNLAPDPAPDPDSVKSAFEAMQSPVARLVHESLWLSGVAVHDEAVAAHTRALDCADADDEQWRTALAAWSHTLSDEAYWFRLERRAKELDDPRVSVATVTALRSRLPRRVLAPNAELAAAAAAMGDTARVARHVALLHHAPFPAETVAAALRDACNPVVDRIHDECAALTEGCSDDPSEMIERCTALLAEAPRLLAVPAAVLPDDGLSNALHDEIANTITRAAVARVNDGGEPAQVQPLLDAAAKLAREKTTVDLVERTRRGLAEAAVLAVVEPWISSSNPDGAVEVLTRWRRRGVEPHLATEVDRVVRDPRAVRAALADVPTRAVFAGCGVRPYGHRARAGDTWVETRFVTVFWVPVYPLGSYLSDDEFVYARVPTSHLVRWLRLGLPIDALLGLCLLVLPPPITAAVALATAAVLAGAAGQRRRSIDAWLDERLAPSCGRHEDD